ncbi:unnamed protein product [Alopecurus aequalis]
MAAPSHRGSHGGSQPFDLAAAPELDDDGRAARTGNLWTCVAHIITGVIGAGVLALSWSVAQLGWVAGPIAMVLFAGVTYVSGVLLSHCYRSPAAPAAGGGGGSDESSPGKTRRNYTYMDAVRALLGRKHTYVCGTLQYLYLYGIGVAYTLTTAVCLGAIKKSNCYHAHGRGAARCGSDASEQHLFMLLFGVAQLVLSFIPNFHSMAWLSAVAAAMSFTYATIGLGLGLAKTVGDGAIRGSAAGVPVATAAQKTWLVAQAVGDIAFAYPYTIVLLEIQDTLRASPPEGETMRKGNVVGVLATTFFYLCVGCFGYAAFGNAAPGNLLTGFGFYEPYWLVDFANACIILHILGGYQARDREQSTLNSETSEFSSYSELGDRIGSCADVQPADIHGGRQVVRGEVPGERVREQDVPHQDRAGAAEVRAEPAAALLQDGVRGHHHGARRRVPLLQRGAGPAGRAHLLAARHLPPRRDVLRAAPCQGLDADLGHPAGVQRRLLRRRHLRSRRLRRGHHQEEARIGLVPQTGCSPVSPLYS